MLIGEEAKKLSKLMKSGYIDLDNPEVVLLDGAPPDIVELFNWYKEILEVEKKTGRVII